MVKEFCIGRNETVSKKRRAHDIKNRNSENVRPVKSIVVASIPSEAVPYTKPELLEMLRLETNRAKKYLTEESTCPVLTESSRGGQTTRGGQSFDGWAG